MEVRQYYRDYVASQRLSPYLASGTVVTSVKRVDDDDCFRLPEDCDSSEEDAPGSADRSPPVVWEVCDRLRHQSKYYLPATRTARFSNSFIVYGLNSYL